MMSKKVKDTLRINENGIYSATSYLKNLIIDEMFNCNR